MRCGSGAGGRSAGRRARGGLLVTACAALLALPGCSTKRPVLYPNPTYREVGEVHPHPSPMSGKLRGIGPGLVDGDHHREPWEGAGRHTEADGVAYLQLELPGESSLQGDLRRRRLLHQGCH